VAIPGFSLPVRPFEPWTRDYFETTRNVPRWRRLWEELEEVYRDARIPSQYSTS